MDAANENWGAEAWRAPKLEEGETVLFDEPGRVLDNICYRSHYFRIVKREFGGIDLLVKHGGGQERFDIGRKRVADTLQALDSDARYFMIYTIYRAHKDGAKAAAEATERRYKSAFAEGALKKRKLRGQDAVKVWIERPLVRNQ